MAFQIQVTPTLFGTIVRVSLADLLGPFFLGLVALDSLLRRAPPRIVWSMPWLWAWLAAMTAALTISLLVGRHEIGQWFAWALVSKYAGWFVLLWYFLLGAWFVTRLGRPAPFRFLQGLVLSCAAIATLDLLIRALRLADVNIPKSVPFGGHRLQGLMENPNAYAFLIGMALLFWLVTGDRSRRVLFHGVTVILLTAVIMAASRGLWLALALMLPFALWLAPRPLLLVRPFLFAAPLAIMLVALISAMPTVEKALNAYWHAQVEAPATIVVEPPSAVSSDRLAGRDPDLGYRVASNLEALRRWWDSPLFGQGLGSFLWSQGPEVRFDGFRPTIHNSLLWILAEMGLVGAVAFLGFFLLCLRALWPGREAESDPLRQAGFLTLILFAGMSLSTEVLYQRHVWFLLGLLLAVAPALRPGARNSA